MPCKVLILYVFLFGCNMTGYITPTNSEDDLDDLDDIEDIDDEDTLILEPTVPVDDAAQENRETPEGLDL